MNRTSHTIRKTSTPSFAERQAGQDGEVIETRGRFDRVGGQYGKRESRHNQPRPFDSGLPDQQDRQHGEWFDQVQGRVTCGVKEGKIGIDSRQVESARLQILRQAVIFHVHCDTFRTLPKKQKRCRQNQRARPEAHTAIPHPQESQPSAGPHLIRVKGPHHRNQQRHHDRDRQPHHRCPDQHDDALDAQIGRYRLARIVSVEKGR